MATNRDVCLKRQLGEGVDGPMVGLRLSAYLARRCSTAQR